MKPSILQRVLLFFGLIANFKPTQNSHQDKEGMHKNQRGLVAGGGRSRNYQNGENGIFVPGIKTSHFVKLKGRIFWLPAKGLYKKLKSGQLKRHAIKIGRNEPCPCGATIDKQFKTSMGLQLIPVQKKYKHCCINKSLFFPKNNAPANAIAI